jgi:hypothetical protein
LQAAVDSVLPIHPSRHAPTARLALFFSSSTMSICHRLTLAPSKNFPDRSRQKTALGMQLHTVSQSPRALWRELLNVTDRTGIAAAKMRSRGRSGRLPRRLRSLLIARRAFCAASKDVQEMHWRQSGAPIFFRSLCVKF